MEDFMKKIRRILSFVIAMAMIMSMSTLCFLVTAEGGEEEIVAHGAGTTYTLDLDVANGEYSDGVFTLSDGPVNAPEAVEEGQTLYAAPTSGNYSVDVFPTLNGAFIAFKAPVDGVYKINAMLEKLAVEDGNAVINFASCVFFFKEGAAASEPSGNTGWKSLKAVGETANHTKTFKMEAGDVLVLQVGAEEGAWIDEAERNTTTGNDKAIALKDFTVTCVYTFEVGNTYTLDIDIATDGYTDGLFQLGSGAADTPNTNGAGIYTDAASDEYSVDIVGDAKVYFTAPVDGVYSVNVDLEKLAVEDESAVINFASCVFYFKEGINSGNTGWKSLKAVGETANHTKTFTMKAGETLTLEVGAEEGDWIAEAERNTTTGNDKAIALKDFSVTHIASTESGTKYSLDIDTSTDGYTDGMFMLGTGDVYNPNTNGAGIYTDAASDEYSVDIVGDAKVYFTAPVDGEYTFNVDLEKLAVNDGGAVSHFASIVFYISGDAAKDNTGWGPINGAGTTANHSETWVMQAGDMIVLQVGPESDNTTVGTDMAIALKDFTVTYNGEHVCSEWNKDGTCVDKATCVLCGEATGEFDRDNHTAAPTGYTDNGDGTHTVEYVDCCNATGITEVHNFTEGGTCSMGTCGATLNAESEDYVISFNPYGDKEVNNEETVAVELQISGSATHYASGKIVVYYNADVFTFVGATGTLSDVTVDSNVDGKLVIVMYGEDHELTEDLQTFATLTFKAKKLTAPESSDIVLGEAGFSTQTLAETEDLTPAIKYYSTLSVVVNARVFDVELDSDLAGNGTATEGADYGFTPETVTGEYYNYSNLVVMVDEDNDGVAEKDITEFVQGTGNGPWTIPGQYVTGELAITVDRTEKTYSVTIVDGQGNDVSISWIVGFVNEATYGTDYVFEVIPDPWTQEHGGIKYVVESVMAGTTDRTASRNDQLYTITGTDITGDIVITMSGNEYDATGVDVVFDGPGTTGNEPFAPLGDDYLFTVTKEEGWIYTIQYKVGAEGTLKTPDLVDGKYVVPAADFADELADTIYVFVTRVEDVANLEVYEYLTLNNGVKLYLVLNNTAKLENSHFTMNGEAMFWSDRYDAYCYLVASTTVVDADVAATYTYTVAAGAATEVDYGMDVNKSGKMDANDAQLVYNMYRAEYEGITANVTVEKYLRADVSADVDYKVDAADATAIANACLN